jgi:hypothetical protein
MEDPMSAAVAWDVAPAPLQVPVRPGRPRLVSVPCGDATRVAPSTPLRLTRAGRLAITVTVAAVVVVLAMMSFSGGASATAIDHSTTVTEGQTLSDIAVRELPQLPVADAVARLQVANDLTGSDIHAGQTLLIPAVG